MLGKWLTKLALKRIRISDDATGFLALLERVDHMSTEEIEETMQSLVSAMTDEEVARLNEIFDANNLPKVTK